jgi:hypothetical protein
MPEWGIEGRSGSFSMHRPRFCGMPQKGDLDLTLKGDGPGGPKSLRYHAETRRSGRVAEGGALLRRYGAEWLHRGFESLLLRLGGVAERSNAAVSKTVGGRFRRSWLRLVCAGR